MHCAKIILTFSAIFLLSSHVDSQDQNHPSYQDEIQLVGQQGQPPANRVTITIGEKNNYFRYTANGITYTPRRISVSGNYYNNDFTRNGYAYLYLTVEPRLDYWHTEGAANNVLNVYAENEFYDPFYFEIVTPNNPYRVSIDYLRWTQWNATTIRIEGPPISYFY